MNFPGSIETLKTDFGVDLVKWIKNIRHSLSFQIYYNFFIIDIPTRNAFEYIYCYNSVIPDEILRIEQSK